MATASNDYFGFELLNKLVGNQLNKKEDVILLFSHWFLVKNGFKCIGLGDSKTIDGSEQGVESLPEGWNQQEHYTLRYIKDGKLYILLGRKSDDNMLLNFLRVFDGCVSNVKFHIETIVNSVHGSLPSLIPTHQEVVNKIFKELVEPVFTGTSKEIATQTQQDRQNVHEHDSDQDPLRVGPIRAGFPRLNPHEVGRRDLDPFAPVGPHGGGMLYDPFGPRAGHNIPRDPRRPGGLGGPAYLPPGAIPPGARFDHFGPPDLDARPRPIRRNPDHDHFNPPGFDDNMFM